MKFPAYIKIESNNVDLKLQVFFTRDARYPEEMGL